MVAKNHMWHIRFLSLVMTMISARGVKSMDIRLFSPHVKDAWETLALVLLHWHTMGLHEVLKPLYLNAV